MSQRSEIVGVQYLRGFCAIAVVLDHTSAMSSSSKYLGQRPFGGILERGATGVDIFFVISGFIITIVTLRALQFRPILSRTSFFQKRFIRIIPLMWLAIGTHLLMRLVIHSPELETIKYVRAAALWPSSAVEPSTIWTLRHEFIFYVVFAISLLGFQRWRAFLLLWCAGPIVYAFFSSTWMQTRDDVHLLTIILSPVNIEFGFGVVVGLIWLRWPYSGDARLPIHPVIILAMGTAGVILLSTTFPAVWLSVPNALFVGLLGGGLVWVATRLHCPGGWLSDLARLVGTASYSIYLFHMHCVAIMLWVLHRQAPHVQAQVAVIVITLMTIIIGIFVHLTVETRLVRRLQRLFKPREAGTLIAR